MTGAYLRVQRDGKWQNLEIEHLTDAERKEILGSRDTEEVLRWLDCVCHELAHMDNAMNSGRDV